MTLMQIERKMDDVDSDWKGWSGKDMSQHQSDDGCIMIAHGTTYKCVLSIIVDGEIHTSPGNI